MQDFTLSDNEKEILLELARESILLFFKIPTNPIKFNGEHCPNLKQACGNFVSIYIKEELRGCIGYLQNEAPLYESIQKTALSAATKDTRFSPLMKNEIKSMQLEISVLSPLKKITDINKIVPGKHGIYIKKGLYSGTYLPQVAKKTKWTVEEMLGHCSRDKAGIGWLGWKDADIFTYEAIVFRD